VAFLIFLLFIPVFWLMIVRPQQQQRRAHQEVVASLEVGQQVMTVGGLIGTLTRVEPETVGLDVGDGTELTFGRTFIRQQIDDQAEAGPQRAAAHEGDDVPTTHEAPDAGQHLEPGAGAA
jgi:preprotein translocase subunit YajC